MCSVVGVMKVTAFLTVENSISRPSMLIVNFTNTAKSFPFWLSVTLLSPAARHSLLNANNFKITFLPGHKITKARFSERSIKP